MAVLIDGGLFLFRLGIASMGYILQSSSKFFSVRGAFLRTGVVLVTLIGTKGLSKNNLYKSSI